MIEKHLEVPVVPLGWIRSPCTFDSARHGIAANAARGVIHPAETLLNDLCRLWGWPKSLRIAVTVCLANGMPTGCECHGLFVVHGHARKRFADVGCRPEWIRLTINTLWVYVNQAHLHCCKRVLHG